jgi:YYY domain-containing protein
MKHLWTILIIPFLFYPHLKWLLKVSWPELLTLTLYPIVLSVGGLLLYPAIAKHFSTFKDGAYGVTKTFFIIIWGGIAVWIPSLITLELNTGTTLGFLSLALIIIILLSRKHISKSFYLRYHREIIVSEFLFLVCYLIFLSLGALYSDHYGGEKSMDLAILIKAVKAKRFPLEDPWAIGHLMKYYYSSFYYFAQMIKLLPLSNSLAYHSVFSLIPALFFVNCITLFRKFLQRQSLSIFAAFVLMFAANLQSLKMIFLEHKVINSSFFWKSTRLFTKDFFSEFPSWSFLFRDFHPHVVVYPFTITFLVFLYRFFELKDKSTQEKQFFLIFLGFSWGSLFAMSAWDFLFMSLLFLIMVLLTKSLKLFVESGICLVVAVFLYLPAAVMVSDGRSAIFDLARTNDNTLSHYFLHHGHWLIVLFLFVIARYYSYWKKGHSKLKWNNFYLAFWPMHLGLILTVFEIGDMAWSFLFLHSLLFLGFNTIYKNSKSFWSLLGMGIVSMSVICDSFIFMDQLNTIFKFFNIIYVMLGVLALSSLRFPRSLWRGLNKGKKVQFLYVSIVGAILFFLPLGSGAFIYAISKDRLTGRVSPHLDGYLDLKKRNYKDYAMVNWINENLEVNDNLLEVNSDSFKFNYGRISQYTGISTLLGWHNHVFLRGLSHSEIERRKILIKRIYNDVDALRSYKLLKSNNIHYLIIGELENKHFEKKGLAKFGSFPNFYEKVFSISNAVIYRIL